MEHKIVDRESFFVLGTVTRVTPDDEGNESFYATIWKEFEEHHERVRRHSADQAYYGISFTAGEEQPREYVAGMAVGEGISAPAGLAIRRIPAARYAIFECPVAGIGETYGYIFRDWLPHSPYELNREAPVFEQYPPEGETDTPVRIHIPIKVE